MHQVGHDLGRQAGGREGRLDAGDLIVPLSSGSS